jgi:anaerobic glycerol-3-phosphate dehydrogenase
MFITISQFLSHRLSWAHVRVLLTHDRNPWIVEAALRKRQKHFVIDGEAVILGVDGYSDFNALHSGRHNEEVQLCAFDVLGMDGDDLRDLPLSMRKANRAEPTWSKDFFWRRLAGPANRVLDRNLPSQLAAEIDGAYQRRVRQRYVSVQCASRAEI